MGSKYGRTRKLILDDAHSTRYIVHPGCIKMYQNLKKMYWWPEMKGDVGRNVENCLTCLQVKINHQKLGGEVQSLAISYEKVG